MVEVGDADGFVGGLTRAYPTFLRPCLEVIGTDEEAERVVGMYMMAIKGKLLFIGVIMRIISVRILASMST